MLTISRPMAATSTRTAARSIPGVAAEVVAQHASMGITFDGDADLRSPTKTTRWSTATRCCCWRRGTWPHAACSPTPRGCHHDVQHGPGGRTQAHWHPDAARTRRRQICPGRNAGHRRGARRRAIRPHHFTGRSTTGDGLLTALLLLDIVHRRQDTGGTYRRPQDIPPGHRQRTRAREAPAGPDPRCRHGHRRSRSGAGRYGPRRHPLLRQRGLARVMIEAESEPLMHHHANAIAAAIRSEIGV